MESQTFLEAMEQVLSHAVERSDPEAVAACRRLAASHAPVPYSSYPVQEVLTLLSGLPLNVTTRAESSRESMAAGNPTLTALCIQTLCNNLLLGPDAEFSLTLREALHTPGLPPALCLEGRFEGPGHLPERLLFDRFFAMSLNDLTGLWTRATRDGRIDRTEAGLTFWLKAARVPPSPLPEADSMALLLSQVDSLEATRNGLRFIDGDVPAQAANILLPIKESLHDHQEKLDARGISVTIHESSALPPMVARRSRLRAYWDAVLACALWQVHSGLHVEISFQYDARQRECGLLAKMTGEEMAFQPTHHFASMRRVMSDHDGGFLEEFSGGTVTLLGLFPDAAGRTLDDWIPGWEHFSERSQQMLRLLKGGGQTPPEEFILGGVLEDELERRLLPRLELPAARNAAKDLEGRAKPFANAERMNKALGQVARGKPKKDICQPVYAAELLAVLGSSERGRQLLGIEDWTEGMLRECCGTLLDAKLRPIEALRWVAKWLR